jgi:tetratricopeptide (TPR) repeat protein
MGIISSFGIFQLGDLVEAHSIFLKTAELRTATLGADHKDTLDTLQALANVSIEIGNIDEAKDIYLQVLESQMMLLDSLIP